MNYLYISLLFPLLTFSSLFCSQCRVANRKFHSTSFSLLSELAQLAALLSYISCTRSHVRTAGLCGNPIVGTWLRANVQCAYRIAVSADCVERVEDTLAWLVTVETELTELEVLSFARAPRRTLQNSDRNRWYVLRLHTNA